MVLMIPKDQEGYPLCILIEEALPSRRLAKRIPIKYYLNSFQVSKYLNIPLEKVLTAIMESRVFHGVITPDGLLLVHPANITRYLKKQYFDYMRDLLKSDPEEYVH